MVINIVILFIGLGAGAAITWIFATRLLKQAQQQLRDTFGNLSAEALRNNNESFVQMAKTQLEEKILEAKGELGKKEQAIDALVKPLNDSLEKMDTKIHQLEVSRIKAYGVALQAWPGMIEEAMKNRIIVATPTVLLSILLGVGYSWNQLKTMENIEAIRDAAVELHDRSTAPDSEP